MKRKPKKTTRRNSTAKAEAAGEQYAQTQLQSDYFMDWVREQLSEAARMDPKDVLPLETKADALLIARNMLQQLEWDTKRDLDSRALLDLMGPGAAARPGDTELSPRLFAEFYDGFRKSCDASQEWLADELLELKSMMNPRRRAQKRVHDYIAVDRHDRPVGPRHKGYSDAKRDADNAGGTVKFVPSSKRAPVREMRRPKAGRSARRRR